MKKSVDAVVIACNTATALAINQVRHRYKRYSKAFIGVEPAIKPALALALPAQIAVLVTHATAQSERFIRLCRHLGGSDPTVLACLGWVEALEAQQNGSQLAVLVRATLTPLIQKNFLVYVLGCTHFPLLLPILQQIAPQATFLEPSQAVARQLARVLGLSDSIVPDTGFSSESPHLGAVHLYSTSNRLVDGRILSDTWQQLAGSSVSNEVNAVHFLDL